MGFWIKYSFLILLCIVVPSTLMIKLDVIATEDRAKQAGTVAARAAPGALTSQLRLEAHKQVGLALTVAQEIVDKNWLKDLGVVARRPAAIRNSVEALTKNVPAGGFAWLVDHSGAIVARNNQNGLDDNPENIKGHPLFHETQAGYALDGFWYEEGKTFFVGAVPVNQSGQAAGAVFIGKPINGKFTNSLAAQIRGLSLTTVIDGKILSTTLPNNNIAQKVVDKASPGSPTTAGELSKPLESGKLFPFTPIFIKRNAKGLAYASLSILAPGGGKVRWIASVDSAEPLRGLAERQENLIGLFLLALLFAILFGLAFHRGYVKPIDLLVDHLSTVQMRRGTTRDIEEFRVSAPFRRLVKLVNMTVKKLPAPTSSAGVATGAFANDHGGAPISDSGSASDGSMPLGSNLGTGLPISSTGLPSASPLDGPGIPSAPPFGDSGLLASTGGLGDFGLPSAASLGDPGLPMASSLDDPGLPPAADPFDDPGLPMASSLGDPGLPPAADPFDEPGLPPASSLGDLGLPPAAPMALGGSNAEDDAPVVRSAADIRGISADALAERSIDEIESDLPPPPVDEADELNESPLGVTGGSLMEDDSEDADDDEQVDSTVVARVDDDLIDQSRNHTSTGHQIEEEEESATSAVEQTMIATVPQELLQATANDPAMVPPPEDEVAAAAAEEEDPEMVHFRETYERFIKLREECGEATADLSFQRFEKKLQKNRDGLVSKYGCKSVRFQVYEKNGKAALKATPIRA